MTRLGWDVTVVTVVSDVTEKRRGNIYIGSEKGRTKTHRAREVHDRASPNHSHETDEMSGIDFDAKK